MYNLAIRKCTSPPLLAPRLKFLKLKFTTPPGIEPRTCWTRGRHATIWANTASCQHVCNVFAQILDTHTRARTHTHTHTHTYTHTHIYIYVYVYKFIKLWICKNTPFPRYRANENIHIKNNSPSHIQFRGHSTLFWNFFLDWSIFFIFAG